MTSLSRYFTTVAAFIFTAAALLGSAFGAQTPQIEKISSPLALTPLPMNSGGRMLTLKDGSDAHAIYRFQWPGIYFTAAFTGPDVYFSTGSGDAILHLLIDDQPAIPLLKPGAGIFRIGGLSAGAHRVRVEFVTENQGAPLEFGGFALAAERIAGVPPRFHRQIEIIGDSHTVGYGNTSGKRQCSPEEVWATTDNSQAFGPLTAKYYQADYQINAISGRGIVRSYNGMLVDALPVVYPSVLFDKKTAVVDLTWQPQIIVVALGTNDFSTQLHDGEKWKTRAELYDDFERSYVHFVQQLRRGNPETFFILAANDAMDGEIQREVRKVIEQLATVGETRVGFVAFNKLELTAADWHPSLADHELMAAALRQFIDARPELWHDH